MKRYEQLQWHECWDCENYDQLEKRCDRLNIPKARNSYSDCVLFRPRDLGECGTCHWYNKNLHTCFYSNLFIEPKYSCGNYEYRYKEIE